MLVVTSMQILKITTHITNWIYVTLNGNCYQPIIFGIYCYNRDIQVLVKEVQNHYYTNLQERVDIPDKPAAETNNLRKTFPHQFCELLY